MDNLYLAYLVHLAYFFTLLSYCFRNVNYLRVSALVASVIAIYYACYVSAVPLWTPVIWNALFSAVNLGQLLVTVWRRRSVGLGPTESFLAKTALLHFPPAEVKSFAAIGNLATIPAGTQLIHLNSELQELYCILSGRVGVYLEEKKVAELVAGRFVGEMSLLTRSPTRADVFAETDLALVVWTHQDIERWVDAETARLTLLQTALGTQIVEQLLEQKLQPGGMAG